MADQSRIVPCPLPDYDATDKQGAPVYWLALPARWTGGDVDRKDTAVEKATKAKMGATLVKFAACLALCESWNLPGLPNGTLEPDALRTLPWEMISWVNTVVWDDFQGEAYVPKES